MQGTWSVVREGEYNEGLRWQIHRTPLGHLTAYVGIPEQSPLAGLDYEELDADENCPEPHGGWTFSEAGSERWPIGWWWWGWDYAHAGDLVPGGSGWTGMLGDFGSGGHHWTEEEVQRAVEDLLPAFDAWLRRRGETK